MATAPQILTANRLRDGEVVYWRDGGWSKTVDEATIFGEDGPAKSALAGAEASVKARLVVNPYLFAVRIEGGEVRPVEEREIIRAAGPTIRRDLGKQARHVPL
ncbi:MAG: DUF2849 domain-containing protein [Rhizomicrobium sp.]|jgi:hypothetical protein